MRFAHAVAGRFALRVVWSPLYRGSIAAWLPLDCRLIAACLPRAAGGAREPLFECRKRPSGGRLRVFHHRGAGALAFRV